MPLTRRSFLTVLVGCAPCSSQWRGGPPSWPSSAGRRVGGSVAGALLVDDDLRRLRLRVVAADRLDHAAVARRALIRDDDAPDRVLLAPHAGESYSYGHKRRRA